MIEIDITESSRLEIQRQLDSQKTQDQRNKLGQFATPTELATDILQYAKSLIPSGTKHRFLDPAFGTGAFFSALLQTFPHETIIEAIGYEIDPLYAHEVKELWKNHLLKLFFTDFTHAVPPETNDKKPNLLICNPPYVRHHHLMKTEKQHLQRMGEQATGIKFSERTGLYGHFLHIAHSWMAEDGLAGWLIPSEFMDVNYGQQIKEYLLNNVTLLRIHCFDPKNVQFNDALVSSAIVWFKKAIPLHEHSIELTYGGTLAKPQMSKIISSDDLTNTIKWTKIFLVNKKTATSNLPGMIVDKSCTESNENTKEDTKNKLPQEKLLLSDLFNIKRGLATGANDFFILTQEQISKYQLPTEFLTPVLPNPRYLPMDEIRPDNNGNPLLVRCLSLLTCNLLEQEIEAKYPSLWEYFQMGVNTKVSNGYLCRNRKLWYMQEKRPICMFLCAYMGRQSSKNDKPFRFLLNRSKATATNAYHLLYPKPFLQQALEDNPEMVNLVWQALQAITSEILMGEGRVYGGGLHKMEPKELANVPANNILPLLKEYSISFDKSKSMSLDNKKRKDLEIWTEGLWGQ